MNKYNLYTQRLDNYFSSCIESNKFYDDRTIEQTFEEIILPHALEKDSKLYLNADDKFYVEIYEDKDGIVWICTYTSKDISNEEYMLYQFRLSVVFNVIEDEWKNDIDGKLKRIIKKIKIHDIYMHDIEELKEIIKTIYINNLADNYRKEVIETVNKYIEKEEKNYD